MIPVGSDSGGNQREARVEHLSDKVCAQSSVCLRLKPQERITIITDTVTRGIAAALQSEVERIGSEYSLFVLEHHARRPLSCMPEIILGDVALAQVSIFAAQSQPGELGARTELTAVVNHHRI